MTHQTPPQLSSFHHVLHQMMRSGITIFCLIVMSLVVGVVGYKLTEHMPWIDAFQNASMILSGMGPASEMQTAAGKIFASIYALYSGLFLIAITGAMLLPILHKTMLKFHLDEDAEDLPKKETSSKKD